MTSLLFLSTRDQQANDVNNAYWNINMPRLETLRSFKLSLQNIEFPNTVYPINATNQSITVEEVTGLLSFPVIIPSQNYSAPELKTTLISILNTASASFGNTLTYTVTYDTQTKKFTIGSSGSGFRFVAINLDAYQELGFDEGGLSFSTAGTTHTGDWPVHLAGTNFIDVVTNFSTFNHSVGTTSSVMVRVPINVPFGNLVFYEPSTDDDMFITSSQLNEVYMQLRDDKGYLWPLPNNAHVSLTLKIEPTTITEGQHVTGSDATSNLTINF